MSSATEAILSRAAIGRYPVHPMPIDFPVAALIALVGVVSAFAG